MILERIADETRKLDAVDADEEKNTLNKCVQSRMPEEYCLTFNDCFRKTCIKDEKKFIYSIVSVLKSFRIEIFHFFTMKMCILNWIRLCVMNEVYDCFMAKW